MYRGMTNGQCKKIGEVESASSEWRVGSVVGDRSRRSGKTEKVAEVGMSGQEQRPITGSRCRRQWIKVVSKFELS